MNAYTYKYKHNVKSLLVKCLKEDVMCVTEISY